MAEYFVGPVMEKLVEKLIDVCFEYLKDQGRWQTGMKEELQKLRRIHPQIKSVVSAYNQVEIEDPSLDEWLWQLRDAIDEADDVLDEFEYRMKREEADFLERAIEIGKRALKIDPYLKRLEEAVHKLSNISAQVSNFHTRLEGAKQKQKEEQLELIKTRETGSTPPANDFLGRSNDMEFVRNWLTATTNTNISVLSVVGHGGMGKTTLLQHVFSDGMTVGFDVKIWICVSINFDANMVIKNILESLKQERPNLDTYQSLQSCLQSEVRSKRFLLVLDDIWEDDEPKWEKVLAPLHHGGLGSKILITTRMDSVASMFAKMIKNNQKRQLEGLPKDECLRLLNSHAFVGVENPDDELRSIAAKMVERLSGCPLAAKVVGGVLNSYVNKSYWTQVLNTNIENIEPSQNYLLRILKLSYIYLDESLQNCFSFCCMFRQDHEFDKDDLVRMWIALGFIQSSDIQGETLEDKGRRYFNILVQKSFFDEFHKHERVYYKTHDLLHELAQSVSTKECFRVVNDKEFPIPPKTIRHLYIKTRSSRLEAVFQKIKFENLRSLFLSFTGTDKFDEKVVSEILKASKSIRLLVISSWNLLKIPEGIVCLTHLRYLKLDCELCSNLRCSGHLLPRFIDHLYHLQFIFFKKLKILEKYNLCCQLIMDELIIKDPSMLLMEPLRSISSFRSLKIEENNELVSFPIETEQWFLQHTSSLFELKFKKLQSLQSLPFSLESLSSLKTLHVSKVPQLKLLPNPPTSLRILKLCNLESLQCLPSSLSTLSSLEDLTLRNIPLLKSLPDLPSSLERLNLVALQCCLPSSLSTFSSLNFLLLKNIPLLKSLPDLPSSLNFLHLQELENLRCLPSCLPTTLLLLWIIKVPHPLELPDLPASLTNLHIEDCHPHLMARYPIFDRRW